jgi:small conductance mechanosensitive channel
VEPSTKNLIEQLTIFTVTHGLSALGGIIILILGWMLAGWVARAIDTSLGRLQTMDPTLRRFTASLARYLILMFTVLAVLSQFGIQTASLIAVFGAAGLAIGLALQGTLSNLAAGIMILIFRPFRIGDDVEAAGSRGTVEAIDLFSTDLCRPDNVQLVVPNGKIWGQPVTNYSAHKTRRLELKLVIDDSRDLDETIGTVRATVATDSRVLSGPGPAVTVSDLTENAVTLTAQVWCAAADHEDLKVELMKALKGKLKAALKTAAS